MSGLNAVGDRFKKGPSDPVLINDFSNNTFGAFSQLTANLSAPTIVEAGLRLDHHQDYGNFVLPRVALFHRFSEQWATRIGLGLGYKTPNALAQQTVEYSIEDIEPLPPNAAAKESVGYNAEVNFKKEFGHESSVFINQTLFLTQLNDPLVATEQSNGHLRFANAGKAVVSKGSDTCIKAQLRSWELYAGYTFTVAERNYLLQNKFVPLTPGHRFAFVIVRELGETWRFGLEGLFTGRQYRYDYSRKPGYLFLAGAVSRTIGSKITLVLNCENLTDTGRVMRNRFTRAPLLRRCSNPCGRPLTAGLANLSVRYDLSDK